MQDASDQSLWLRAGGQRDTSITLSTKLKRAENTFAKHILIFGLAVVEGRRILTDGAARTSVEEHAM